MGTPVFLGRKVKAQSFLSLKVKCSNDLNPKLYFDLTDIENTVGSWDMYGQDAKDRYPAIQNEFFNRAGQALKRRDAMLSFCAMAGTAACLIWGAKGSKDAK